jgi:hypothetical protein
MSWKRRCDNNSVAWIAALCWNLQGRCTLKGWLMAVLKWHRTAHSGRPWLPVSLEVLDGRVQWFHPQRSLWFFELLPRWKAWKQLWIGSWDRHDVLLKLLEWRSLMSQKIPSYKRSSRTTMTNDCWLLFSPSVAQEINFYLSLNRLVFVFATTTWRFGRLPNLDFGLRFSPRLLVHATEPALLFLAEQAQDSQLECCES